MGALTVNLQAFNRHPPGLTDDSKNDLHRRKAAIVAELQQLHQLSLREGSPSIEGLSPILRALGNEEVQSKVLERLEGIWDSTKRCRGLVSIDQSFRYPYDHVRQKCKTTSLKKENRANGGTKYFVSIDAVLDDGEEWLRLVNVTERNLLFQIAKNGWIDEEAEGDGSSLQIDDGIEVVHQCHVLVDLAKSYRHNCQRPRVHFVFNGIEEGRQAAVDAVLRHIRGLGGDGIEITVSAASSAFLKTSAPPLTVALDNLLNPFQQLSKTVNLDRGWLLALTSDVSHGTLPAWDDAVEQEKARPVISRCEKSLLQIVYPALRTRQLVCTTHVAAKFREIMAASGHLLEMKRARLLLGDGDAGSKSSEEVQAEFASLSSFPVAPKLHLPIRVVDDSFLFNLDETITSGQLPEAAHNVYKDMLLEVRLPDVCFSAFFYGWATGITTVTANGDGLKRIAKCIENNCHMEIGRGPHVLYRWVTARLRPNYVEIQWPDGK